MKIEGTQSYQCCLLKWNAAGESAEIDRWDSNLLWHHNKEIGCQYSGSIVGGLLVYLNYWFYDGEAKTKDQGI